jgi:hypothetical protein
VPFMRFVLFVNQPWAVRSFDLAKCFEFHPGVVSSSRRTVVQAEGQPRRGREGEQRSNKFTAPPESATSLAPLTAASPAR